MESEILTNLIEIKGILKSTSPNWIPAAFTLLGVFIAGFWQYLNSRINLKVLSKTKELEIKSEVISKQRQQWMDDIRKTSSIFLAEYDVIVGDMGKDKLMPDEHAKLYKSTNEKASFIALMLNINKPTQKNVVLALTKMQVIVGVYEKEGAKIALEQYDQLRNQFTQSLLVIFAETWSKIKKLE